MKTLSTFCFLVLLMAGCTWEEPTLKTLKNCQRPTSLLTTPNVTSPKTYNFSFVGNTSDVASATWKVTTLAGQAVSQVVNANAANYSTTVSADGTYTLSVDVLTTCGDKLTFNSTFTANSQLPIASSFSLTDPMVHSRLNCALATNDGSLIANESNDIKVWNPATRTLLRTLKGHTGYISWMALSPDEKYLYSCSGNESIIYVWDWKTGAQLRTLTGHTSGIVRVQVSADGKYLASLAGDKTIRVWDTTTWQLTRSLPFADNYYGNGLAISGAGNLVAGFFYTGSTYYFIVWNYVTGAEVWRQTIASLNGFNGMAFSPDGLQLYLNYYNGSLNSYRLQVYEATSKQLSKEVSFSYLYNMAVSVDGKYIMGGGNLYSLPGLSLIWSKSSSGFSLAGNAMSANGQYVTGWTSYGAVDMYSLSGATVLPAFVRHPSVVGAATFTKDSRTLATIDASGTIKTWDIATGQTLMTSASTQASLNAINYTADDKFIISAGQYAGARILNAADGAQVRSIGTTNYSNYDPSFVAGDGSFFVNGSGTNVLIRDVATGNTLKTLSGHTSGVINAICSPDSKSAISSSGDLTLRIWNVATSSQTRSIPTQVGSVNYFVNQLAVSPDGQYIVGGAGTTVLVWNAATGQLYNTFSTNSSYSIGTLAYSLDGKLLATGSYDGKVRVWNILAGTLFKEVQLASPLVKTQFSPDGKQIYAVTAKDLQVLTVN